MKRLAVSALLLALLVGCGAPREQNSSCTVFAMDTVMTLTAYGQPEAAEAALRSAEQEIRRLDHLLSATDPGSEIAMLNPENSMCRTHRRFRGCCPAVDMNTCR